MLHNKAKKGNVRQWIFHCLVNKCSSQGFCFMMCPWIWLQWRLMPMVYHAAHFRLTVLRSVCRESFSVVIEEALGWLFFSCFCFFICFFMLKVKPGVKFGSLVGEWTQCSGVVICLSSFCIMDVNEPVEEWKTKTRVKLKNTRDRVVSWVRHATYKVKLSWHFHNIFCNTIQI